MVVEDGPLSVHVREAQVSQLQIVCDGLQTHLRTELDRMRERGIRGGKIFTHISIITQNQGSPKTCLLLLMHRHVHVYMYV